MNKICYYIFFLKIKNIKSIIIIHWIIALLEEKIIVLSNIFEIEFLMKKKEVFKELLYNDSFIASEKIMFIQFT